MTDERSSADRPAAFGEVFANREYRAVFLAMVMSWVGDYLARAAVTAMVFQQTRSVALSAATFAISYLPWIVGGPVLAAVAERYPYRTVMIVADLARAVLIALVAMHGLPIAVLLGLLFLVALLNPPFDAARSALLPRILEGDRYVLAISIQGAAGQAAIIAGYLAGGTLASFHPRIALLVDAITFAVSALAIRVGVRSRAVEAAPAARPHLLRETAAGFRLLAGSAALRSIAMIVFASMLFAVVPEGLAAAWAGHLSHNPRHSGVVQGLIMIGNAVGFTIGGLAISRMVAPGVRVQLIRPFAMIVPLALVPALLDPPAAGVVTMAVAAGFAVAGLMPAANGLFVQALPNAFRARAFGLMQTGLQLMQGIAVITTGVLARRGGVPTAVGLWGVFGLLLMGAACVAWPSAARFAEAVRRARETNELDVGPRRRRRPAARLARQGLEQEADTGGHRVGAMS